MRAHVLLFVIVTLAVCALIAGFVLRENGLFLHFESDISDKKDAAKTDNADGLACLHDADCRRRLEAAVNQIYSEIGYEEVFKMPQ